MTALALIALLGATLGAPQDETDAATESPPASAVLSVSSTDLESARGSLIRGVNWLVDNQQPDGSWGTHHSPRPIEVLASVPGSQKAFKVATTALGVSALQSCALAGDAGRSAVERGLDYLIEEYDVKRMSGMEHYNVWSFGYALQAFGEYLVAHPEAPRSRRIRSACRRLVDKLGTYQTLDGGWGYLSLDEVPTFKPSFTSMSFTTATVMVGMAHARSAGIELPEELVQKAVDHLKRSRLPDGAFLYGEYLKYSPRMGINAIKGSACRNPVCHHALQLFGEPPPKPDTMVEALRDLFIRHASLQRAALRRPIPHESWYAISGYFYLYGHAYAAIALEELPAKEQNELWPALIKAVQVCEQPDGSFWDYPLYSYHKPYGTAFAVQALSRVPGIDAED